MTDTFEGAWLPGSVEPGIGILGLTEFDWVEEGVPIFFNEFCISMAPVR